MLWMKKEAHAETTIKAAAKRLIHQQKNCYLAEPESVKVFMANKKRSHAEQLFDFRLGTHRRLGLEPFGFSA